MDRHTIRIIASLAVPSFAIGTDFIGALMLITPIEHEFAVDITTTQWVLNVYALTFAMGMVAGGRLGDIFGRRRLLLIGLGIFVIASAGCAIAPSVGWLIAARAVQGIGPAIAWPCLLGIASTSVRQDERGYVIGLIFGAVSLGNVVGPMLGGVTGGLGDWRLFFVVNVILGVLSIILVSRLVPSDAHDRESQHIDYFGMFVLSASVLALLYALDVGPYWGWISLPIIALFATSAILFVAFPLVEQRVTDPMVPPSLLRNRQFMLALSTNGLLAPAMFLLYLYAAQYFHKVLGWSVLWASIGTLPMFVCMAVFSTISGRFYNQLGPRLMLSVGYTLVALGSVAVILVSREWGYPGIVPPMLLIGIGSGIIIGPAGTAAVSATDASHAGLAGGLSFMFHLGFGAIGVAAGTAVLFSARSAFLQRGLEAMGVTLSTADQLKLTGNAPGAPEVHEILGRFSPEVGDRITVTVQEAFVTGMNRAYWLALAFAVVGIIVALCLNNGQLKEASN